MRRLLLGLFSLLALSSAEASAQDRSQQPVSTYDIVKQRGTVVVGLKNDYPPYGYLDSSGKWVGIEVEFAEYIATKLGVKLKMEAVSSRTRIPMLVNGNIDMIATLSPTRE